MLNKFESYIAFRKLANYGRDCYQTNLNNSESKYDRYSKLLSISIWKLSQELEKKGIKSGRGFSTIGTDFEEIPNANVSGTAASDIFANPDYFVQAINCIPKQMLDYYEDEVDTRYLKARFALQDKSLSRSVFPSTG